MPSSDARDLFMSIVLRDNLSSIWRKDREAEVAKLLAPVGEMLNDLGGLFGAENFYGETTVPWNGETKSALRRLRDGLFLDTSEGELLSVLGGNYGAPRPPQSPNDDDLYRKVIPILAWLPKTPMLAAYRLAEALFGKLEDLDERRHWAFYEVNANEIIFEIPAALLNSYGQANASYLHGFTGRARVASGPSATILVTGEDLQSAGDITPSPNLYVFHTGVWNTYTISSATYNAGTRENSIVLSAATVPTGDWPMFVDFAGNGTQSFPGDFMLADASTPADNTETDAPASSKLVYLAGRGLLDIFDFYFDLIRAAGVALRIELVGTLDD